MQEWLEYLASKEQSMFRSDCPNFFPLGQSQMLLQKLDSNIIFYERKDSNYNLVDIFAVNNGPPIVLQFGTWVEGKGLQLEKSMNRWERRTDLMGAKFVNTLWDNEIMAHFIYNENGTIIGSDGWLQEILQYVIGSLNLTVETRSDSELFLINDKPVQVTCAILMREKLTDICSGGMAISYATSPLAIDRQAQTLLVGIENSTAPDAWVYTQVFDTTQWLIYYAILILISVALLLLNILIKRSHYDSQGIRTYDGLVMTSLFFIQQGSHPEVGQPASKRITALTTALLTLLVFIYYSNDITSKMTAGTPPTPIRTFEDVLDHGYKVIIVGSYYYGLLRNSKNGSAKQVVYQNHFAEFLENIQNYEEAIYWKQKTYEQFIEEGGQELPWWYEWNQQNLRMAAEKIKNDPETLFYCASSCLHKQIKEGTVLALDMDDTYYTLGGFGLPTDSEYLSMFNHYLLKAFERGILHRISNSWLRDSKAPIKIGITEPEPLGINNVMFPLSFLGVAMISSVVTLFVEKVAKKIIMIMSKRKRTSMKRNDDNVKISREGGISRLKEAKEGRKRCDKLRRRNFKLLLFFQ